MSIEENKMLVRRVYDEFTNQRNLDLADQLFGADFVDHASPPERSGIEGVKETMRRFVVAFPDFQFTIEDVSAEGSLVHVRGTINGTQLGPYGSFPVTGKHAQWSAMDDFRIEGGKIVERWSERNRLSLFSNSAGSAVSLAGSAANTPMSVRGAQQAITAAVAAWPGVTTAPHRFGGTEYRLGERRELGHIHGDHLVDVPLPTRLRDEVVAAGRAEPHHILGNTGWISFYLRQPDDVEKAIALLRLSYEVAARQTGQA